MCKQLNIIFTMISGSHLYGFSSENSDIDIRGVFIANTKDFLGLSKPLKVYNDTRQVSGEGEYDIVLDELGQFVYLLTKGNCNRLEQIFSEPKRVYNVDYYDILRNKIAKKCIFAEGLFASYGGLAKSNYNKWIKSDKKFTAKKWLYIFRALLAGCFALEHGKIEPNILQLQNHYDVEGLDELIELKKSREDMEVVDATNQYLKTVYKAQLELFEEAYQQTDIPKRLTEDRREKINDSIIEIRLHEFKKSAFTTT